jgi:hypothetical protein
MSSSHNVLYAAKTAITGGRESRSRKHGNHPVAASDHLSATDQAHFAIHRSAMVIKAALEIDSDLERVLNWFENDVITELGGTPLSMVLQGRHALVMLFLERCARVESDAAYSLEQRPIKWAVAHGL